jgi:hypothetical protein
MGRYWKRLLLALLLVVLLSQIPFAYRRLQLARLSTAIKNLESERQPTTENELKEYKGVIHVHSFLGGHSTGTFQELIAAANSNKLDFVLMTEHVAKEINSAEMTLKGLQAGVLFINGSEVSTNNGDRLLIIPGTEVARTPDLTTQNILAEGKQALAIVAYPEEFRSWDSRGYDGIEVYNVYSNARSINRLVMFLDGLWSYRSYPDLLFARIYARPDENLARWDSEIRTSGRRIVGIAGNDAHSNIGISVNDSSGNELLGMKLDPYHRSFQMVRMHVLLSKDEVLDQATLLSAIKSGHCFVGFDIFSDSSGFRFEAVNKTVKGSIGDEITLDEDLKLKVTVPIPARVVVMKDGAVFREKVDATQLEEAVTEQGSYRVEVYLPQLGELVGNKPWIISNPIYVR